MAIAAQNAKYTSQGPTGSGQILANSALSNNEVQLLYTATVTLDGSTTSFVVNYIDGTATLPYTPTAVTSDIVGGTQVAAAVLGTGVGSITATGFTVYLSGAGTAANTITVAGFIIK